METRDCSKCGVTKPYPDGFYASYRQCKKCVSGRVNAQQKARTQRDPEYAAKRRAQVLAAHFKRAYGLSQQDYQALMEAANYECEICSSTLTLCVDHDHITGAIRGVLCKRCNNMLGQSLDSPTTLRKAADYLERTVVQVPV